MAGVRRITRSSRDEPSESEEAEAEAAPPSQRRRNASAAGAAAPSRGARRRPRDDDDESDDGAAHVTSGWGGYKQAKESSTSRFDRPWRPEKGDTEEYLVKFLEDGPFATFKTHWVSWAEGQKSHICLDDDCPLDEIGLPSSARARFNVAILLPSGETDEQDNDIYSWQQKTLETGITVTDTLQGYSDDRKIGPLSKDFFAISVKGSGKKTTTDVRPVKTRDVVDPDDWDADEPTKEQLEAWEKKLKDKDSLSYTSKRDLQELADSSTTS